MKCSICGTEVLPETERCTTCGCRLQVQAADTVSPFDPSYQRPAKKKRTWLWILIPVVLVCLLLFSLLIFMIATLFSRLDNIIESEAPIATRPIVQDEDSHVQAEPASEECFRIDSGVLTFLPERYEGGPVLQVPETIGGETVTAIGLHCFQDCDELTTIVLPDTVTRIEDNAFDGCKNLRGLYLPDGTETIGADAFAGCIKLESICIPASVAFIAPGAFDDCAALMYIFYGGEFEAWHALYSDYIMPYTFIICPEGDYYHVVD